MKIELIDSGLNVQSANALIDDQIQFQQETQEVSLTRTDVTVLAAIITGGAVVISTIVTPLITHALEQRDKERKRKLKPERSTEVRVIIFVGDRRVELKEEVRNPQDFELTTAGIEQKILALPTVDEIEKIQIQFLD
jgi:hypothetical protein